MYSKSDFGGLLFGALFVLAVTDIIAKIILPKKDIYITVNETKSKEKGFDFIIV